MLRTSIAITALIASVGGTAAQGDAVMGETVFNERCAGCHSLSGESDTAPALDNLIGRPAASLEGVQYSDGMIEAGQAGVVWDVETLTKFITKPRTVVNGTRMAFTGLSKPEEVANVIAYLATFSSPPAR